jgi:hypothetical protein
MKILMTIYSKFFYTLGELVCYAMLKYDWHWLYPTYSAVMLKSFIINEKYSLKVWI